MKWNEKGASRLDGGITHHVVGITERCLAACRTWNRMEVIVVQGPAHILKEITEKILSCKGVLSCKLTLTDIIIPQVCSAPAVTAGFF
jgi:NikR C terminal nickel binding domain